MASLYSYINKDKEIFVEYNKFFYLLDINKNDFIEVTEF